MKNTFGRTTLIALLALALGGLTACDRDNSDDVDQDQIFTEYELFYNQNNGTTYARATFKFGNILGDRLELSEGAEVSFNGDVLEWQAGFANYEREYAGLIDTGSFMYVDLDGNTFVNEVTIESIDHPSPWDTLSRDAAFELFWVGTPLNDSADVTVTVNGNSADGQSFFTSDAGANSIVLDRNRLQQLESGPGLVWLDRRTSPGIQQGTSAGGLISGRFRPLNAGPYVK